MVSPPPAGASRGWAAALRSSARAALVLAAAPFAAFFLPLMGGALSFPIAFPLHLAVQLATAAFVAWRLVPAACCSAMFRY